MADPNAPAPSSPQQHEQAQPQLPHVFQSGSGSESPRPFHYDPDNPDLFRGSATDSMKTPVDPDPKARTKSAVKHRRSRKGCLVCRSRKVKCDETRPVCTRCIKAGRECKFPEDAPSSSAGSSKDRKDPKDPQQRNQPTIQDLQNERTPSLTHSRTSDSPSGSEFPADPPRSVPESFNTSSKTMNLDPDVQFYFDYHRENIQFHYYYMNHDCCDFYGSYLLTEALAFEPLLYAVVAKSAYHFTADKKPDGELATFLRFYSKSMSLLRQRLETEEGRPEQFLLTILTLAALEEMIGITSSLFGHQKAACHLLLNHYTTESMTQSVYSVKIVEWYLHFDFYLSVLSCKRFMDREWYVAVLSYFQDLHTRFPENQDYDLEERSARLRLGGIDIGGLNLKYGNNAANDPAFKREALELSNRLTAWYKDLDPAKFDIARATEVRAVDSQDKSDARLTWAYWRMLLKFEITELTAKLQLSKIPGYQEGQIGPSIVGMAIKASQMADLILKHDALPNPIYSIFTALSPAGIILGNVPGYEMWYRRMLAMAESSGQVQNGTIRQRFKIALGVESDWWLPNDELRSPIVDQVRDFSEERAQKPEDMTSEGRSWASLKGLFRSLNIEDPAETLAFQHDVDLVNVPASKWKGRPIPYFTRCLCKSVRLLPSLQETDSPSGPHENTPFAACTPRTLRGIQTRHRQVNTLVGLVIFERRAQGHGFPFRSRHR